MKRRVTIKDVAKAAGVSTPVVSSVVNNASKCTTRVSPKTREKVERIAREIGYTRSNAAAVLRTNKTFTIAILGGFNHETGWLYTGSNLEIMVGVNQALVKDGRYGLMMDLERSRKTQGYLSLEGGRIDGAIIVEQLDEQLLENLEQANIPYVTVNIKPETENTVYPDDLTPLEPILTRWRNEKVSKIGYIQPKHTSKHHSTVFRGKQVKKLCKELGFSYIDYFPENDESPDSIIDKLKSYGVDGVVSYSESLAQKICSNYLCQYGVLPFDHVLCWERDSVKHYLLPAIESISIPFSLMGEIGADMLIKMVDENKHAVESVLVKCEVTEAKSFRRS